MDTDVQKDQTETLKNSETEAALAGAKGEIARAGLGLFRNIT